MTWHFFEVWALLLAAFALGGVLGTLLYIGLAVSPLAEAQLDVADAVYDRLAAIGAYFARWRTPSGYYGLHRDPPAYVMPIPAPDAHGEADLAYAEHGLGPDAYHPHAEPLAGPEKWVEDVAEALNVAEGPEAHEHEGSWSDGDPDWREGEAEWDEETWPEERDALSEAGAVEAAEPLSRDEDEPLYEAFPEAEVDLVEDATFTVEAEATYPDPVEAETSEPPLAAVPEDVVVEPRTEEAPSEVTAAEEAPAEDMPPEASPAAPLLEEPSPEAVPADESPAGGSPIEATEAAAPTEVHDLTAEAPTVEVLPTDVPSAEVPPGEEGADEPPTVEPEQVSEPGPETERAEIPAGAPEPMPEPEPAMVASLPEAALPPPVPPPVPAPIAEPAPVMARQAELPAMRPLTLPGPRNGVQDNLQRIRGIGKKNEELLNSLGIYHFGQIAAWTPAEARWVARHMAFPERIERDDWIGQAIIIATGGDPGLTKPTRRDGEAEESSEAA